MRQRSAIGVSIAARLLAAAAERHKTRSADRQRAPTGSSAGLCSRVSACRCCLLCRLHCSCGCPARPARWQRDAARGIGEARASRRRTGRRASEHESAVIRPKGAEMAEITRINRGSDASGARLPRRRQRSMPQAKGRQDTMQTGSSTSSSFSSTLFTCSAGSAGCGVALPSTRGRHAQHAHERSGGPAISRCCRSERMVFVQHHSKYKEHQSILLMHAQYILI